MQGFQKLGYSKKEAAQVTSLSLRSIDYLLATGKLQGVKVGRRVIIYAKSLEKLVESGTVRREQSRPLTEIS